VTGTCRRSRGRYPPGPHSPTRLVAESLSVNRPQPRSFRASNVDRSRSIEVARLASWATFDRPGAARRNMDTVAARAPRAPAGFPFCVHRRILWMKKAVTPHAGGLGGVVRIAQCAAQFRQSLTILPPFRAFLGSADNTSVGAAHEPSPRRHLALRTPRTLPPPLDPSIPRSLDPRGPAAPLFFNSHFTRVSFTPHKNMRLLRRMAFRFHITSWYTST